MQFSIFRSTLALLSNAVLAACSMAPLIGDTYGEPPPQVAYLGAKDAKGNEYLTWVNVSSFGPVPSQLQAAGDINCMKMGFTLRAVGYHPKAMDVKGKPTPNGGFYCQPKPLQTLTDAPPPRVVMVDGVSNWDRPRCVFASTRGLAGDGPEGVPFQQPPTEALGLSPPAPGCTRQAHVQAGLPLRPVTPPFLIFKEVNNEKKRRDIPHHQNR